MDYLFDCTGGAAILYRAVFNRLCGYVVAYPLEWGLTQVFYKTIDSIVHYHLIHFFRHSSIEAFDRD